jgi:hypothetical protein
MGQSVVGELRINMKLSTAAFFSELGKVPGKSKEAAQGIQDSFDKVSFGESRGGLIFIEDILGTKLPRHLNNLITTLPGVGAALSVAFPVLGAVLLIEKIVEFTTKFNEAQEKIKAGASAYADLALSTQRHAASLEIDNLKLADQLRILNGGVEKNGMVIAFEGARLKAEELTSQITKAIGEEKKLLEDQSIGFWKGLLGNTQTSDIVDFVTKSKAAIADLEHQKEMALIAHQDTQAASIQKEIDSAYKVFQDDLASRKAAEESARKEKITKDFDAAIARATNDTKAREAEHRNTPHQQETSSRQMQAAIIAPNALASPSTLPTFSQTNLSAPSYNFRSNWVPVSIELVHDSAYDVVGKVLVPAFAQAIARGASAFMTTGTGSGQPQGILTGASSSGVTTASPTAITATELETFYMSLDRAYRTSPNCAWLMSDATYLLIRKLTDTTNLRPLIDIVAGESYLFNKRVLTSPSMPAVASLAKPILFGDLSAFYVATTEMQIQVLTERNAEFGQIVVGAGMRIDSRVVAPGSAKPLVYLNMHA